MPEKELTLRIGRREFTREAVIAILSAATITIADCGGGGSSNPSPSPSPTPTPGDVTGTVSANHGHTAVVTAAQITAANEVSLDIRGSATHPHTVGLSADGGEDVVERRRPHAYRDVQLRRNRELEKHRMRVEAGLRLRRPVPWFALLM